MPPFIDARIPLVFGQAQDASATDALLREGVGEISLCQDWFQVGADQIHPANCACCAPRNAAGAALARLMLARGRGRGVFFTRVLVITTTTAGRDAVRRALETDPIASAYFREVAASDPPTLKR